MAVEIKAQGWQYPNTCIQHATLSRRIQCSWLPSSFIPSTPGPQSSSYVLSHCPSVEFSVGALDTRPYQSTKVYQDPWRNQKGTEV